MYSWVKQPSSFDTMFHLGRNSGADAFPPELTASLARWALMYDVPLPYLVVREEMLPPESIRFFHVDYNFIFALLDGALSLGRSFTVDYLHDAEYIDAVIRATLLDRFAIRPQLQGIENVTPPEENGDAIRDTGFLLRSELVRGWRGLEIKALDEGNAPLRALRLEAIEPDILLGIYAGSVHRLEIAQPPEGLHYGFTRDGAAGYEKLLRSLTDGTLPEKERTYAKVVMRSESARVVNIADTGANIAKALGIPHVNASHIALEMIQNALTGIITRE